MQPGQLQQGILRGRGMYPSSSSGGSQGNELVRNVNQQTQWVQSRVGGSKEGTAIGLYLFSIFYLLGAGGGISILLVVLF